MKQHNRRPVELLVSETTRNRIKKLKGGLTYEEFILKILKENDDHKKNCVECFLGDK